MNTFAARSPGKFVILAWVQGQEVDLTPDPVALSAIVDGEGVGAGAGGGYCNCDIVWRERESNLEWNLELLVRHLGHDDGTGRSYTITKGKKFSVKQLSTGSIAIPSMLA